MRTNLIKKKEKTEKKKLSSSDGKYKCMDMDIKRTGKETGERYVNINTISHLIYNGVKYVVE